MTTLRLAVGGPRLNRQGGTHQAFTGDRGPLPALLVSFAYWESFADVKEGMAYRHYALDSGAFTAHASGKPIDLQEYTAFCIKLMSQDALLDEVFALDVIGDADASVDNCEKMIAQGVPAIPTFHMGSPFHVLESLADKHGKIALGGMVGMPQKKVAAWVGQCFARVWPKKMHGFGMTSLPILRAFPFHSVDASTWELGPSAFGWWRAYGGKRNGRKTVLSVRGAKQDMRAEVDWYVRLERELQGRWQNQIKQLEAQP